MREVLGFIGIMNIQQCLHLVVVVQCSEVCKVLESLPIGSQSIPQIIFELNEIEFIPIERELSPHKIEMINPIKEKIKKYLRNGFYFGHNFELTMNA